MKDMTKQHWSKSNMLPAFTLSAPDHNKEIAIMEGGDTNSLLFGPYRAPDSHYPWSLGTVIIHGQHHFNFLRSVNLNDKITLGDNMGSQYHYLVEDVGIIDLDIDEIGIANIGELKLVTNWPFDRLDDDNKLRYIVTARKDESYKK